MIKNIKFSKSSCHEENQYINLIEDILNNGFLENTRNGAVKTIFGAVMHFSLENNCIPMITTKKLAWKSCLKELLWFIKGDTDNKKLIDQNVNIWNFNGSREFLDQQGLTDNEENDLGPIYGHQWRHYNATYKNCKTDYTNQGVDQLQNIIDQLKDPVKRFSRRLILNSWNPEQIDEMALPPCHVLVQFNVSQENKLSCMLYQRSADIGLGVPFNITSYCFLTHILAKHCGLEAYEFIHTIGNAHIYLEHIGALEEQIKKKPYEFPKIEITNIHDKIDDYCIEDINIINYKFHEKIFMEIK
jgi:thymidylate synthase